MLGLMFIATTFLNKHPIYQVEMKAKATFIVLNGVHLRYLKILDPCSY